MCVLYHMVHMAASGQQDTKKLPFLFRVLFLNRLITCTPVLLLLPNPPCLRVEILFSFLFREYLITKVFSLPRFFLTSLPNSVIPELASAPSGERHFVLCNRFELTPIVSATLPVSQFVCTNLQRIVQ